MKRILLLGLLVSSPLFTQEVTPTPNLTPNYQNNPDSVHYDPHTIAISYRAGGTVNFRQHIGTGSQLDTEHFGTQNLSIDIYTQERKGKTKYSALVGLRFTFPNNNNHLDQLYGRPTWGFIFGGSQYVFDQRNTQTGIGWSMLANGGMTLEFGTDSAINTLADFLRFPVIIGAELEFKSIYNFHKYVGITFGAVIGYGMGFDSSELFLSSNNNSSLIIDQNINWGISMGLIF